MRGYFIICLRCTALITNVLGITYLCDYKGGLCGKYVMPGDGLRDFLGVGGRHFRGIVVPLTCTKNLYTAFT